MFQMKAKKKSSKLEQSVVNGNYASKTSNKSRYVINKREQTKNLQKREEFANL